MPRILITVLALLISSTAMASTPILSKLKNGSFAGTIKSFVSKSINGKKGTLEVQKQNDGTLMVFTMDGAVGQEREEWLVQGDTLVQREYNKQGQVVRTYSAAMTVERPVGAGEATYVIHCANKVSNDCDGGIDSRNAWTIAAKDNAITYTVWGVEKKADRVNPKAQVVKRHEFTFTSRK
jgi:hypothetical protein